MHIRMIGIDHNRADIAYREQFSFTKTGAMNAMKQIKNEFPIDGCVMLCTCNRTELWVSEKDEMEQSLIDMICEVKGIQKKEFDRYQDYFVERKDEDAIIHLMELACGLDSKIFGEDQIISQVKDSLSIARDCCCADMVMEKLFQAAIAAGKKVKSTVQLTMRDQSTATRVVQLLKNTLESIKEVPCLIIGNGKMAKLIATELHSHGANVTMTLRKKIHKNQERGSNIAEGCHMLAYEDRISAIPSAKVVISATLSPHYTIRREDVEGKLNGEHCVWIDLAVPRDIEPSIGELENITLYDIDTMGGEMNACNVDKIKIVNDILNEQKNQLVNWLAFRQCIPKIKSITKLTAEDLIDRLCIPMENMEESNKLKEQLQDGIVVAAEKAVGKILYGLRDTLQNDLWQVCMQSIEEAARKNTLKTGSSKIEVEQR